MHLTAEESSYADDYLTVTDNMVTEEEIGPAKPGLDSVDECQADVTTYSYIDVKNKYEFSSSKCDYGQIKMFIESSRACGFVRTAIGRRYQGQV